MTYVVWLREERRGKYTDSVLIMYYTYLTTMKQKMTMMMLLLYVQHIIRCLKFTSNFFLPDAPVSSFVHTAFRFSHDLHISQ